LPQVDGAKQGEKILETTHTLVSILDMRMSFNDHDLKRGNLR